MRIMLIIPTLSGGGAERVLISLANALVKHRHEVRICVFEGMETFYETEPNVSISNAQIFVRRKNRVQTVLSVASYVLLKARGFVKQEIKEFKPDIVISFLPQADIATGLVISRKRNFRYVCSERNDPTKRHYIVQAILNLLYQKSDVFVCQSKVVQDYYRSRLGNKAVVIPNPIVCDNLPAYVDEATSNIVAIGRLDPQKNFPLLIRSFHKVIDSLPSGTRLTIYGEGRERKSLETLINELNLGEKVLLPGSVHDLHERIKDAALFVMSSSYEGFPNALLEAMALGLPVISTDFPTGTAKELIGLENGIVVSVDDEQELADAIYTLMTDRNKRNAMRRFNRSVRGVYSMENIYPLWEQAIL